MKILKSEQHRDQDLRGRRVDMQWRQREGDASSHRESGEGDGMGYQW